MLRLSHSAPSRASCLISSRSAVRNFSASAARLKQNLVILGSGWGGYEVLRKIDKKRWNLTARGDVVNLQAYEWGRQTVDAIFHVTIVSPTDYFNFTPLLASCAVGTLEFRCAMEPVSRYSPEARIYQAWCDKIDLRRKTLQCMPATPPLAFETKSAPQVDNIMTSFPGTGTPFTLRYDKLVIAVGSYSQTFGIPGVKEYGHFLKNVGDARSIRMKVLQCFEQANQPIVSDIQKRSLLNFCIVGGGPTGVEFSAELHDLIRTDMAQRFPSLARLAKITLYDVAPNILGEFDRDLAGYAEKKFKRDGISILTSHHVDKVEPGKMYVREQGEVHFGLLVWSTGLAPNPLIETITELQKDPKTHSLITNDHLNVLGLDGAPDPDVWAIGDASRTENSALPATAQVANQKGKYVTKKLNRIVKDKDSPEPFEFKNLGTLAYIGDWKAIYDRSTAASGPKTKETGRVAWLLWRSAYFTMTLSMRNKILIPTYWFLNWIFGRDLTRF